jgi:site-specific DNA-adenine methylase
MAMRTAFSHYGGKGMISGRYPQPKHKIIIEPFAGGASYSLRYYKHDVILCDKNDRLCAIWDFLINKNARDFIGLIPKKISPGEKISEIISPEMPDGLVWMLRSAANIGLFGTNKINDTITQFGSVNWKKNTIDKIEYWHGKISHWKIINGSYEELKNIEATWFIDPPYNNTAGSLYRFGASEINYKKLAKWIKSRRGLKIVCENSGAEWMKFKTLSNCQGLKSKSISKNRPKESFCCFYNQNM